MAKHERTCLLCGEHYLYCSHCDAYKDEPKWKYLFHDQNCKDVSDVWYAYRGKEITKEEARKKLEKLDLSKILAYNSVAVNELKAIMADDKKPVKSAATPKQVVVKKDSEEEK